jgi:adenosylcobinamide-GDP ribazoletransferase
MLGFRDLIRSFFGAVIFYTIIPPAPNININLTRIARFSPIIGLIIGFILFCADFIGISLHLPVLTRSALIVALWVGLTGGLHLDGAMDSADGLGVTEPERRLQVMQDSHAGAFGVMAAIVILLLKTAALSDLSSDRGFVMMGVAGWGRWSQVGAIAFYPYLKPTGKGAFHKESLRLPQDILLGWLILIGFGLIYGSFVPGVWLRVLLMGVGGTILAQVMGYYFYRRLGGHTGDTYGAVVEWTETLLLCLLDICV